MNLYAYCGNNPVNRLDPEGKLWILQAVAHGGGAIGAIGAIFNEMFCAGIENCIRNGLSWNNFGNGVKGNVEDNTPDYLNINMVVPTLDVFWSYSYTVTVDLKNGAVYTSPIGGGLGTPGFSLSFGKILANHDVANEYLPTFLTDHSVNFQ